MMASTYNDALSPPFTDLLHAAISMEPGEETWNNIYLKTSEGTYSTPGVAARP